MLKFMPIFSSKPSFDTILGSVIEAWPEHETFLRSGIVRYLPETLAALERISERILALIGGELDRHVGNYRWMCEQFFREEVYFRRHGYYRLSSFAEAEHEVYSNPNFMTRYMDGLLLSQVLWSNHANGAAFFIDRFLPEIATPFDCLEIGPGHGLFAGFAASHPLCRRMTGWDVSPTSLEHTRASLVRMGIDRPIDLVLRDVLRAELSGPEFDVAVISEVLEHLEEPDRALATLFDVLRPGGRILANLPINSPAPDHIYLLRTPAAVEDLVKSAGFEIETTECFPMTGYDLPTAMQRALTVSCLVVARRPLV
jgi:2-polyprenyl-3-methyl-5-hydroxy-6-metoxy-1,4-benzoquinol methylase